MNIELRSHEELIDDQEVTTWQLIKKEGAIVITINKLFDEHIIECDWYDDKHRYLQVMYSNWDGLELFAIVNTDGEVIRDSIRSIEEYIEKPQLFIVEMSGVGMGSEATQYDLAEDDWKMAVINQSGNFIIPPEYDSIKYYDDEDILYAKTRTGKEYKFNFAGDEI